MSEADYEIIRKMYGWESQTNPLLYIVIIFLLIAIFLIIPYIFVNSIEVKVTTFLREIWSKISFNGRKILRIR
ncbi:hypothetical protein MNV_500020 [Candidatus Methanoperedens nitroreducens]|uniref:Uncharacterized protein n=1 Tax=Candidatus Methanoperedens nitratireducens TaxID=1392998 RepID=A0A284VRR5_9EURY|nr:hypothetical protein MNV_500020 [Candidatus Methanoperedens nitroreducens]